MAYLRGAEFVHKHSSLCKIDCAWLLAAERFPKTKWLPAVGVISKSKGNLKNILPDCVSCAVSICFTVYLGQGKRRLWSWIWERFLLFPDYPDLFYDCKCNYFGSGPMTGSGRESKRKQNWKKRKIGVCLIVFAGSSLCVLCVYVTNGVRKKQTRQIWKI